MLICIHTQGAFTWNISVASDDPAATSVCGAKGTDRFMRCYSEEGGSCLLQGPASSTARFVKPQKVRVPVNSVEFHVGMCMCIYDMCTCLNACMYSTRVRACFHVCIQNGMYVFNPYTCMHSRMYLIYCLHRNWQALYAYVLYPTHATKLLKKTRKACL